MTFQIGITKAEHRQDEEGRKQEHSNAMATLNTISSQVRAERETEKNSRKKK